MGSTTNIGLVGPAYDGVAGSRGGHGGLLGPLDVSVHELTLFEDHDAVRGDGRGFYAGDAAECWSRRVDMRGPTDLDPGPIPLDEAPAHLIAAPPARAVVLRMPRRRS